MTLGGVIVVPVIFVVSARSTSAPIELLVDGVPAVESQKRRGPIAQFAEADRYDAPQVTRFRLPIRQADRAQDVR
jgi:hypothetical protein